MIKKLFNRRNMFFTAGLMFLVLGAAVWVINFSFMKPEASEAASASFNETWKATKVTGRVTGYDTYGSVQYVMKPQKCTNGRFYNFEMYAIEGSEGYNCTGNNGALMDSTAFATEWEVTGTIAE